MSTKPTIQRINVTIQGRPGSPLVIHAFAEKAKQEIRDKQQKKAKEAKPQRNPMQEFLDAKYVDATGRECAPITAIKKAINEDDAGLALVLRGALVSRLEYEGGIVPFGTASWRSRPQPHHQEPPPAA